MWKGGFLMTQLSHPYITIQNGQSISFGGNQSWSRNLSGSGARIAAYGCGALTPPTAEIAAAKAADQDLYLRYLRGIEQKYARVFPFFGMTGFELESGVNRYFNDYGICLRARWLPVALNGPRAVQTAGQMLSKDLPVILSIPGAWLRSRALPLYRLPPHSDAPAAHSDPEPLRYAGRGGHFVTVTALTRSGDGLPCFALSSWGKKYYLYLSDYARAARRAEGLLACGLLALEPVSHPPRPLTIRISLPRSGQRD